MRFLAFCFGLTRACRQHFRIRVCAKESIAGRPLFFYASSNQKRALKEVAARVPNAVKLAILKDDPTLKDEAQQMSLLFAYLVSIAYLPWIILQYVKSSGYRRKSFKYALDDYLLACGYNLYVRYFLSWERPSIVVMSNDHSMLNRILARVCLDLRVPTAYVQHASVSVTFPKLGFDYAFLEGRDALEKYQSKGLGSCIVFLAGIASLDDAVTCLMHFDGERNTIAVCSNQLDSVHDVVSLAQAIKQWAGQKFTVVLRPHPGDSKRLKEWRGCAQRIGVLFSDPQVENATALMIKSVIVVASDSNILLEAAILKAKPICFPYTNDVLDWYGFIRMGVAEYSANAADLLAEIEGGKRWPDYWYAAKYYSEVIATRFEGRSAELIAMTLCALLSGSRMPVEWVPDAPGVFQLVQ